MASWQGAERSYQGERISKHRLTDFGSAKQDTGCTSKHEYEVLRREVRLQTDINGKNKIDRPDKEEQRGSGPGAGDNRTATSWYGLAGRRTRT